MKLFQGLVVIVSALSLLLGGCGSGGADRDGRVVPISDESISLEPAIVAQVVIKTNDSDPIHHLRISRQEDPDNWDAPNPELIRRDGRIYYYGLTLPTGAHYQFELVAFPNYPSPPIVPLDLTQPVATPAQIELYYEVDPESEQE